jgi:CubicO group peptidase (beta-lactamase class C family)
VVDEGEIVHLEAYGYRAIVPEHEVMTTNTIFDLASVSKPTGAGTAALLLIKEGKLSADDLVCKYIPNYHPDVTVRHLMTHYSGLPAYFIAGPMEKKFLEAIGDGRLAMDTEQARRDFTIDSIARCKRPTAIDEKYRYSCLNFISLQRVVETIVGTDVNTYLQAKLYDPQGWETMGWLPDKANLERIAPTEWNENAQLRGDVHDPVARVMMCGISGNAGVFATAEEIGKWAIWYMDQPEEVREKGCHAGLWTEEVQLAADTLQTTVESRHTGYTGTNVVVWPEYDRAVVLLAHRVHPHDKGSMYRLRTAIKNLVRP